MALRLARYREPHTGSVHDGEAYLRLEGLTYRAKTRQLTATFQVYASEAAYRAGKLPLERLSFVVRGAEYDALDTALRGRIYAALKARRFPNAEDVLDNLAPAGPAATPAARRGGS